MLKKVSLILGLLLIPSIAWAAIAVPWNRISVGTESPLYTADGVLVVASSTIGNSNQNGGLTISGGATTTGITNIISTPAANTSADKLVLTNTTAASLNNQQYSGRITLTGQGWKTTATAASQSTSIFIENQPTQATTFPLANLVFSSQSNGGAILPLMSLTNSISANTGKLVVGSNGVVVHLIPGNDGSQTIGDASDRWGNIFGFGNLTLNGSGSLVSVGSTTPFGALAVALNNGTAYPGNNAFVIGSSTASAISTLFSVSNTGNAVLNGTPVGTAGVLQIQSGGSVLAKIGDGTYAGSSNIDVNAAEFFTTTAFSAPSVFINGQSHVVSLDSAGIVSWYPGGISGSTDTGLSRLSAGVLAVGTGTAGSTAGGFIAASSTINGNFTVTGTGQVAGLGINGVPVTPTLIDIYNSTPADRLEVGVSGADIGLLTGSGGEVAFGPNSSPGSWDTRLSRLAAGIVSVDSATRGNSLGTLIDAKEGIGTSTPFGKFAISLNTADVAYPGNNAFVIASSTANSTTTLVAIDNQGDLIVSGDAPTLTSCTGGSVVAKSNQRVGAIIFGTGLTSCGVLFAHAYPSGTTVHVFVNQDTGTLLSSDATSITTTGFTISAASIATGDQFSYNVVATQ